MNKLFLILSVFSMALVGNASADDRLSRIEQQLDFQQQRISHLETQLDQAIDQGSFHEKERWVCEVKCLTGSDRVSRYMTYGPTAIRAFDSALQKCDRQNGFGHRLEILDGDVATYQNACEEL